MNQDKKKGLLSFNADIKDNGLFLGNPSRHVELLRQGLSQRAIAAEVGHSKTVLLNFLKDPESYRTKR